MKAIILAAGRGSRMKSLTDECPKCMMELCGKPLLEWQISALRSAGIRKIAIITGYKRELLADRGLTEFHNPRWAETQMVSSLACAQEWLQAEPCIVSYSDIYYEPSAVASLIDSSANLAVAFDPLWRRQWERRFGNPLDDAETFILNSDGTFAEIGQKPRTLDEIEGQYMGLLRFTPKGWAEVNRIRNSLSSAECDKIDMTAILQRVIAAKRMPVMAIPYAGAWAECDSENDLQLARITLSARQIESSDESN